jgi:hypothetical protein
MPIHYSLELRGDILYVTTWGTDEDLEGVKEYASAVIQACRENNCRKVLADERALEYRLGIVDLYHLAKFYIKVVPPDAKLALIFDQKYAREIKFWETVSANRGLPFRAFTTVEAAQTWLQA